MLQTGGGYFRGQLNSPLQVTIRCLLRGYCQKYTEFYVQSYSSFMDGSTKKKPETGAGGIVNMYLAGAGLDLMGRGEWRGRGRGGEGGGRRGRGRGRKRIQ